MKRIIALTLALIFVAFALISCSAVNPDAPIGMQLASDPEINKYYFYVPEGWTVDMSTGITSAYVSSVDHSSVNVAYGVPSESTLAEFWENRKSHFYSVFDNFTVIEEGVSMEIDGHSTARYNYTAEYEGVEYQFLQYLIIRGSYVYIITYTAENVKNEALGFVPFERNLEYVNKIIEEFKFKS
jgi:hypothetical protein